MSTLDLESIHTRGVAVGRRSGLPTPINGPQDAFRHILGSAYNALTRGETVARLVSMGRETFTEDTPEAHAMDRHNDDFGISLARKYGNMADVIDATIDAMRRGNSDEGAVWINGPQPKDFPQGWEDSARNAGRDAFTGDPDREWHHDGTLDDDDEERARRNANTAKVAPDSLAEADILIEEVFMARLREYFAGLDHSLLERIDAAMRPDLSQQERERLLFQLLREHPMDGLTVPLDDDNDPETRRKLLEKIRGQSAEIVLKIQPGWSDPARRDLLRKQIESNSPRGVSGDMRDMRGQNGTKS